MKVGDEIEFTELTEDKRRVLTRVIALHRFPSFAELYNTLPIEKCGYAELEIATASPDDMNAYYSEYICCAYNMPDVFYYAEGDWGCHVKTLGNHPKEEPVSLHLRFDELDNTVVIAGKFTFKDIIAKLIDVG